jgi:hypothetical protein
MGSTMADLMARRQRERDAAYEAQWDGGRGSHHPDYDPSAAGGLKASRCALTVLRVCFAEVVVAFCDGLWKRFGQLVLLASPPPTQAPTNHSTPLQKPCNHNRSATEELYLAIVEDDVGRVYDRIDAGAVFIYIQKGGGYALFSICFWLVGGKQEGSFAFAPLSPHQPKQPKPNQNN